MALELQLDVGHLECSIGDLRLRCTTRNLAIGQHRWPFEQIVALRVSARLFFVEVATATGTHRFYANPTPWESQDWERLTRHLVHWHELARQQGDGDDVPAELLRLRMAAR